MSTRVVHVQRKRSRLVVALTVLGLIAPLTSCVAVAAAAAAGLGLVQYQRNEASDEFESDFEEVWQAALAALDSLKYPVPDVSELGPVEGALESEWYSMRVVLHRFGVTRVTVRVGTFYSSDNERNARILLDEIGRILGEESELEEWMELVDELTGEDAEEAPASEDAPRDDA